MLAHARGKDMARPVDFVLGDVKSLPFPDAAGAARGARAGSRTASARHPG